MVLIHEFSLYIMQFEGQLGSYLDTKFIYGDGADKPPTSYIFGREFLSTVLYQESPPEVSFISFNFAFGNYNFLKEINNKVNITFPMYFNCVNLVTKLDLHKIGITDFKIVSTDIRYVYLIVSSSQ